MIVIRADDAIGTICGPMNAAVFRPDKNHRRRLREQSLRRLQVHVAAQGRLRVPHMSDGINRTNIRSRRDIYCRPEHSVRFGMGRRCLSRTRSGLFTCQTERTKASGRSRVSEDSHFAGTIRCPPERRLSRRCGVSDIDFT